MCQRFPWRGGACPSCNASPIVHFLASRAPGCQSCISLPAVQHLSLRAFPCQPCTRLPILHSLAGRLFPMLLRSGAQDHYAVVRPGQLHLCQEDPSHPHQRPGQLLQHGAPASNKSHLAEKKTPVWLAIWRTWAGFANSQLRRAAFRITYLHICAYPHCCTLGCCSDIANLSAHMHRLPTPPPYLRRMRLSPGQGRVSDRL